MKSVLGIIGSPRRDGNTHILVSRILEGPTALMKAFLDRLYYFCGGKYQGLLEGKEAALVVVFEEGNPEAADATVEMFRRSFAYLKWSFRCQLIVPGVGAKGDILKKPQVIADAFALGQDLAR